jgi:DNA processing protein
MNYAYWLYGTGISNRMIALLLAHVECAEELTYLSEVELKHIPYIDDTTIEKILSGKKNMREAKESYDALSERGIIFLSKDDAEYPAKLRLINDAPYGLFLKGSLPEEGAPSVAIVGARMCSDYGAAIAKELGRALSSRGVAVISGMARGIDAEGHKGALLGGGSTVAVLGGGVDVVYPAGNRRLYNEILESGGAILSERMPRTAPLPAYFPLRNRIISGLSDVVIVVEAKERSGSLITADYALEQGKDIYAVPGRVTDPLSGGCNNLIRQGAGIITDVGEFIKELDLLPDNSFRQMTFDKILLEKEELLVYSGIDLRPKSIEELMQFCGFDVPKMLKILSSLEQKGFITETFKNFYIRRF